MPDPAAMTAAQKAVHDAIAGSRGQVYGPFPPLLHSPELADRVQALGAYLRFRTCLGPRLSELAILVTARSCKADFEWFAHETFAREAGHGADVIEPIRQGRRPDFADPREAAVHDFALALNQTRTVDDATYGRVLELFGPVGAVELTALVGYYNLIAMTLNAHGIGTPDGSRPVSSA